MEKANLRMRVQLAPTPTQYQRLLNLQVEFASACNLVAAHAWQHQCKARVALHHHVYRELREKYPDLGAQLACNAVYAVVRGLRQAIVEKTRQDGKAPKAVPRLVFSDEAPVFFDRHTLGVSVTGLSVFTLAGRLKMGASLDEAGVARLSALRIHEARLHRDADGFHFEFDLFPPADADRLPVDGPLLHADVDHLSPVAAKLS